MEQGSTSTSHGNGNHILQPKHEVFLSHSGAQKGFVEQLCVDLERCDRYPFFDKHRDCLPIGKDFPRLIFEAIEQCKVGVVVFSEEFFTSKWPMLELVAMTNVKKHRPSFTIMPILLGITFSQCRDTSNHKRWLSLWHTWAEEDGRIDVKEWENALQLFGPTNALKYNLELGEVKFREEIVEAICALVDPRTRFEDSHIQGRERLCKVIYKTIEESIMSSLYEVRIVGLYGVGGIGKTTICKAMCNHLSTEYRNKVAHVELGSRSEEELLKEVLGKLTDKSLQRLGAMDIDKYRHHLMRDMMNVKVFLAIDNVSSATTSQALTLLRANYGLGSVVLVTARSLNELTALRIDASDCMEMPELELEEARSLFLYHASCIPFTYLSNKDDHELISSCVERCHFQKGDGISHHYHPLALQALGEQLGCVGYVPKQWQSLLHELDFLNPFGGLQHPVFSILRRSFDALNPQDQLLFMDVALFAPYGDRYAWRVSFRWNIFEWLAMVHGIHVEDMIKRLENLKRKSVLENLGDGFGTIGMHDLWRDFARLETKAVEFESRRWMYEYNALEEGNWTYGDRFVKVKRMYFLDKGFMKLEDVNFSCFPNAVVMKLHKNLGPELNLELDLRGLKHLKSLELQYGSVKPKTFISLVGLGSLLKLGSLRWGGIPSNSPFIDEIGCLTNLQVLSLYECGHFPDLNNLVSLRMVCFHWNKSVVTPTGLSSKHTNLQYLDLSECKALESCLGVGELVALEELCLNSCYELKEVSNLQNLKRLRMLDVGYCLLLTELPGLCNLVSLVELIATYCLNLAELSDMHNLQKLRILDVSNCNHIKSLPSLEELVCLQSLKMLGCENLIQLQDMHKLTNLQTLALDLIFTSQAPIGCNDLISLQSLEIQMDELQDGLDLCKLTKLEMLRSSGWSGQGFSSLTELVLLESATIHNCKRVCVLPNLERLSRLRDLKLWHCEFKDVSSLTNVTSLKDLQIVSCDKLDVLPDLKNLARLKTLRVRCGAQLRDVHGILGLQNLEWLEASGHPWLPENLGSNLQVLTGLRDLNVSDSGFEDLQWLTACSQLRNLECKRCPIEEFPDLTNFPKLVSLHLQECVKLTKLTCMGPLNSEFQFLNVGGCTRLQALPDLTNSRRMFTLDVSNSGVVLSAQLIQDMKTRWPSIGLKTQDISSQPSNDLMTQGTSYQLQRHGHSHGIRRRILGMISSIHCGCTKTSLGASVHN